MNWLDAVIFLLCLFAVYRGRDIGLVQQLFSTVGFFGGLFLGALLEPHTVRWAHTALTRTLVTLDTTLGSALVFLALGEYVGAVLKYRIQRWKLDRFDRVLGGLLSVITVLLAVWLSSAVVTALQAPSLETTVKGSYIVNRLTRTLPPAPNVIADLGHLIDPNGFPRVFLNGEPAPKTATLPNVGVFQSAVDKDKTSVVKVQGLGCGGLVEGSGFVAADDMVITNAHVVAGVKKPYIIDSNGQHSATAIWFDPNLDLAILRVSGLSGSPLVISTDRVSQNTPAIALGYPGGGPFDVEPAVVLDMFTAVGSNIYNSGHTQRDVYEISAHIIPGNSGGPLVAQDARVIGVIFAESTTYNNTGYALSTPQVVSDLKLAEAQNTGVSTGKCAE